MLRLLLQHEAIDEADEIVEEEEDDEVVVHQLDARVLPSCHEFEESSHPPGGVFILVLVDVVVVPGEILFVDGHVLPAM